MPYIITTRDAVAANQSKHVDDAGVLRYDADDSEVFPGPTGVRPSVPTTRTAVATLEEARETIMSMHVHAPEDWPDLRPFRDSLTDSGGTIGPLPDGTVIEVRPVEWRAVIEDAGLIFDDFDGPVEEALATFNDR